jgi:hypothetical protein
MLLISRPEPIPVEEITVLAVGVGVGVAVAGVVDGVDEIAEAMFLAFIPISPYVGNPDQYLSKRRTISSPHRPAVGQIRYARLSTKPPEIPTLRASAGNSDMRNSPTTAPLAGLICWITLLPELGSTRN